MKYEVSIEILTRLSLASREEGDKVLRLWETLLPDYLPDKCGNWEPIKHPFDLNNRSDILDRWQWPFLAKKSKPSMEGSVFMGTSSRIKHATWGLDFRYNEVDVKTLSRFLREACKELEADFGCLTLVTEAEIEVGRQNGTVMALNKKGTRFSFLITSLGLQKCLPDIYWLTVFGLPYIRLFGKESLLSVPVFQAQTLGENAVALQLTEDLSDLTTDPMAFLELKNRVKSFLGEDTFFKQEYSGVYRHPDFG